MIITTTKTTATSWQRQEAIGNIVSYTQRDIITNNKVHSNCSLIEKAQLGNTLCFHRGCKPPKLGRKRFVLMVFKNPQIKDLCSSLGSI